MPNVRRVLAALAAVCAAAAAPACGVTHSYPRAEPPSFAPVTLRGQAAVERGGSADPFGISDTAFGIGLLGAWCRARPAANLVFSPSTLASALGLAYLGARGPTAAAMARVLRLPETGTALLAGLQARSRALGAAGGPGVTVAAGNQVWADTDLPPPRSYLNAAATGYGAGLTLVPLRTAPGTAARQINAAIAAATRGHIARLVTPDMLNGVGWVLTAALYMDATWARPFDPAKTAAGRFTTAPGRAVTARYLNGGSFPVVTAGGWTAVTLPYRGGTLAMTALLPPAGAGACALPGRPLLRRLTTRGPAAAAVSLPKVNLSTTGTMNPMLAALGMGVAFDPSAADFSGLSPSAGFLKFVQQAAALRVGEKGTVGSAAAAAGIVPAAGAAGPPPVVFDRPYLLLVTGAAGEPLFLAKVANPAAS